MIIANTRTHTHTQTHRRGNVLVPANFFQLHCRGLVQFLLHFLHSPHPCPLKFWQDSSSEPPNQPIYDQCHTKVGRLAHSHTHFQVPNPDSTAPILPSLPVPVGFNSIVKKLNPILHYNYGSCTVFATLSLEALQFKKHSSKKQAQKYV